MCTSAAGHPRCFREWCTEVGDHVILLSQEKASVLYLFICTHSCNEAPPGLGGRPGGGDGGGEPGPARCPPSRELPPRLRPTGRGPSAPTPCCEAAPAAPAGYGAPVTASGAGSGRGAADRGSGFEGFKLVFFCPTKLFMILLDIETLLETLGR